MMRFWNFKNETSSDNAELLIYGTIGESWWDEGNDAKEFAQTLSGINAKKLTVRINSGGGDVFAGQAIYSSLKRFAGTVEVYIDGLAASAASVIAMAGKKVIMPRNALLMIHNPMTYAAGEAEDMRKTADTLEKVRDSILAVYEGKTGLSRDELIEMMDAETWFTAEEAKAKGFVDEIDGASVEASLRGNVFMCGGVETDLSKFRTRPRIENSVSKMEEKTVTMTLEKLKAEYPEIAASLKAEGVEEGKAEGIKAERARIAAIEDIALPGHEAEVKAAKFDTGLTAEALALAIIKAENQKRASFLADRTQDAADVGSVEPSEPEAKEDAEKAKEAAIANAFARGANMKRGA